MLLLRCVMICHSGLDQCCVREIWLGDHTTVCAGCVGAGPRCVMGEIWLWVWGRVHLAWAMQLPDFTFPLEIHLRLPPRLQETLQRMKSASTAAAPSVLAAAGPVVADEKEDGGSDDAFGLLNTVGILVGGGLGGYVFLQKTKAKVWS